MIKKSLFHIKKGSEFEVKELFKDISRIVKKQYNHKIGNLEILDIGCASGELPYFLKKDLGTAGAVWGFDISKELIQNAYRRFGQSDIKFFVDDARNFQLDKKFDVILMTSVLSYFDDPYPVLANMLKHLKKGGLIIVTGIFNNWNIDVRLRFKLENDKQWEKDSVLNQFSVKSIGKFLAKAGYQFKFSKQIMPFDLLPKEHPIRSWTVKVDGMRRMTNGLQLLYDIQILQITKRNK